MPAARLSLLTAAAAAGVALAAPAGDAARPEGGALFAGHRHGGTKADFHMELKASRDRRSLTSVFLYEARCGKEARIENVQISPDGVFTASGPVKGGDGSVRVRGRFHSRHRAEGTFQLETSTCDTRERVFAADHEGDGHAGHSGHTHPPNVPDVWGATPADRRYAKRLLRRTRASAARRFPSYRSALRQGFMRHPPPSELRRTFFHLENCHNWTDSRALDPRRPEALVYWRRPGRAPQLAGFMFRIRRDRPEPRRGGPIINWHTHGEGPTQMVHVWLTNEIRTAFQHLAPQSAITTASRDARTSRHLRYVDGGCV